VRRAIDDDDEFRERISVGADEAGLSRPAWLFLRRPPGWEDGIISLVRQRKEAARDGDHERELRRSLRRVEELEESVLRFEAALAVARSESALAATELSTVRHERQDHERERADFVRRVAFLEAEHDGARRRAEALEATVDEQRARLEGLGAELVAAAVDSEALGRRASDAAALTADLRDERDRARSRADALERESPRAAAALGELWRSLDGPQREARAAAPPGPAATELAGPPVVKGAPTSGRPRLAPTRSRAERAESARSRSRSGRVPKPLPSGTRDDSTEAATHLMRVPGMVVLVDGYNATLGAWPDFPIAAQRSRLIDACGELAARTGAEVFVVFDGTEPYAAWPEPPGRRKVRWRFSPADVEADDVLLGLVDDLDVRRPVTVASDDRRVREGAIGRGANAISTAQLFSALRREGPAPR